MDNQSLSLITGTVSSLIFASSYVPMLWKVYKTRDLSSYSWLNIIMVNAGNLFHWLYVASLPLGPVWILHLFYTIASVLLLFMYFRYDVAKSIRPYSQRLLAWFHRAMTVRPYQPLNQQSTRYYSSCSGWT